MMGDTVVDGSSQSTSSQSKKRKSDEKITIINDPVWGPIELNPLCMKIIDTPQFQRLRYIKQLGGCSFVYPGACHSRFEHSIGTAHLARMMGEELQKKHTEETINYQDILCLEVAGLCHDLGHGPFSHLFDQQFKTKLKENKKDLDWTHEDLSNEMLEEIFKKIKLTDKEKTLIGDEQKKIIKDLIKPPKDPKERKKSKLFLYEIISNEENKIDVDKWDYFSRDCHMLGLHHNFQCKRSIKRARIVDNHISFPKSEYFNLFDMFYTRFTLHRRAYQHSVVKAVEMMIADAFSKADNCLMFPSKKCNEKPAQNPSEKAEEKSGEESVEKPGAKKEDTKNWTSLSKSTECMDAYLWVTDDVLQQIRRIDETTINDDDKRRDLRDAQNIIDRIYRRDLYTLIGEKRVIWSEDSMSAQNGSYRKEITDKLRAEFQATPFEIEEAVFHYGNGKKDPMSDVNFYLKKKSNGDKEEGNPSVLYQPVNGKAMKDDLEISDMFPEKFQQIYIRLYWKGSKSDGTENKQKIMDAFTKITDVQVKVEENNKVKNLTVKLANIKSYKDIAICEK